MLTLSLYKTVVFPAGPAAERSLRVRRHDCCLVFMGGGSITEKNKKIKYGLLRQ
jgi:hypothetical protein